MSKFFAKGSSSEDEPEEEEVSENESGKEEEEEEFKPSSRYLGGFDSDNENEPKRVVKSAEQKRKEELKEITDRLEASMDEEDGGNWIAIQNDFNELIKLIQKPKAFTETPKIFIKMIGKLENLSKSVSENSPQMSKDNTRAFNAMKQKLRKISKDYEKQLTAYRKSPEDFSEEEEEEKKEEFPSDKSDNEDKSDEEFKQVGKKGKVKKLKFSAPLEEVQPQMKTEMKPEEIKSKLAEILNERGRKGIDPRKIVEQLEELSKFAQTPDLQVELLTHLISNRFDIKKKELAPQPMPTPVWNATLRDVERLIPFFEKNINVVEPEIEQQSVVAQSDDSEDTPDQPVVASLLAYFERLDDELTKSWQSIDPHTQEYVQRLKDEPNLLALAERIQQYYMDKNLPKQAARIAGRRIEHIYYKIDDLETEKSLNINKLLENLTHLVYTYGDERLKTRAVLCHIYALCLLDRFYEARDIMLMSHLQDSITHMDVSTQVLFNRAMVQLGLCAFRCNLIKEAHNCLSEMYVTSRIKELLAQDMPSNRGEKNNEQENQKKKKILPYHTHINLELVETIHLISAMLLEVPNMAANAYEGKKRIISKTFRRQLDYFDRQVAGPPENTRDIIFTSSKALGTGNWKKCQNLLLNLPIWSQMRNHEKIKEMLQRKIQEEGLRTFLFTYSMHYDSLSLDQLSKMFELSPSTVHSIISGMMSSEELHASWDQPTGCIIMHKVDPTRLQYLALSYAEKLSQFVEASDKSQETRTSYTKYDQGQKGQREKWQADQQRKNYRKGTRTGQKFNKTKTKRS